MAQEHINTFENGWNSDYNIILQPDGTYRFMKNCQLISQDGNNYVIKDCLGNVQTFVINVPYDNTFPTLGKLPMVIGLISFPNKLITISTNNNLTGGAGEIGILNYLPYGQGIQPDPVESYTPLYYSNNLNLTQLHRIQGFAYIENELIERIYWTDDYNELRAFNVSDPIFSTYIPSGSLINGESYMVIQGAITYNGTNYGPGLTDTNVFTANATSTYTNLTTPFKVIKNYPYQLLNFTPDRLLGNITFNRYGTGNLYCGSKVYFYRLGSNAGPVTSWSYGSSPVLVGTDNVSAFLTIPSVPYQDFVGGGTTNVLLKSPISVFITIENLDTNFDYIELACAEYDQLNNVPRQITIVNRSTITTSSITIEHNGSVNLGTLTIGDITLFPASILRAKTLATNKNYMLIGNTVEREEIDIDVTGVTLSSVAYPMNVHRDASDCSLSGMVYSGVSPVSGVNPAGGSITPFSRWLVTNGQSTTNTVIYNGITYLTGQVITGITGAGNDTITFAGTGSVRPCVTKNRYTTNTGSRRENAIELQGTNPQNTCFWDYKSAAVAHHVTGYWEEVYRWGIEFYDKKGNPFFVKWLGDFKFPDLITKQLMRPDVIGNTGKFVYSLNPSILSVSGIVIPPDIINKISGFSIVRAVRDARIVTQGLVTQNVHTSATPDVYRPGAYVPINASTYPVVPLVYSYLCPDNLVGQPFNKSFGVVGDTMEQATWTQPFDYGTNQFVRGAGSVAASEQVYTKFLTCANDNGPLRTGTITYFGSVEETQSLSDFGSGVTYENGNMQINPTAGTNIVGACVPGTTDYTLDGFNATGCKKSVFKLDADFEHYGPVTDGYTSVATSGEVPKILMNYVKTGFSNPYGGTGASSLANTLYISTGHYQPITDTVKMETLDSGSGNYIFNNIEIGGGDCYTCLIDIGYGIYDTGFPSDRYSYAWTFPCECNSNYNLRRGRKTSNVEMYYNGTSLVESILIQSPSPNLEDFSYNIGYSTQGEGVVYPALPVNFVNSNTFQARIRFAGQKFAGEIPDSFRTFAINDFKDLAANYGRINNIAVKEDHVVVWQDKAINTVPILERQLLGSVQGDATTIGTGGVVDRFDVLSSYFGTQHQWSITETEYGFAFFDMSKKAVVVIDFSGGLQEVSFVQGLEGFFNEAFLEIEGTPTANTPMLLNSPTFDPSSDRPLTGLGITSSYDPKFKMTYLTFKFYGNNAVGFKSKDFTVGYLHTALKKCFIGLFDWFPCISHNHNGILLSVNNPKNMSQYINTTIANKSFVVGDTLYDDISYKAKEYICVLDVTLDDPSKYPTGGSGATYWRPINTINQVWVHNQPASLVDATAGDYLYNSFFGKTVDNEIHLIINPKTENPFSVLNIEQKVNTNVNYTDIYIDAGTQSASDNTIQTWDKFYRFIYERICSNLPLSSTGRITNSYLRIKMVKKNWTTAPYIVTTGVKVLQYVKSFFVEKR